MIFRKKYIIESFYEIDQYFNDILVYHGMFFITYGLDYHVSLPNARAFLQILQQVKLGNKA